MGRKAISFEEFTELVDAIKAQAGEDVSGDSYIRFLCKEYYECKDALEDERENLLRWLMGESCEFYHNKLHRECHIYIGNDYDAIYHFLVAVRVMALGKRLSDDAAEYLEYLIRCSIDEEYGEDEEYANEEYPEEKYDDYDEEEDYYDEDMEEDHDYCEEKYEYADFD